MTLNGQINLRKKNLEKNKILFHLPYADEKNRYLTYLFIFIDFTIIVILLLFFVFNLQTGL